MNICRWAALAGAIFIAASLGGCASGARPTAMVAPLKAETILSEANPIYQAVTVGQVSGGEETNPLWTSEVSSAAFRQALEASLDVATIKSLSPAAPLMLDAELLKLDQPFVGLSMTVTSTVAYNLKTSSGDPLWNTTITRPYTAQFSDAFVGAERLRLANEGSVKANIAAFIQAFVEMSEKTPELFRAAASGS